jgi:predicted dehydrogenase
MTNRRQFFRSLSAPAVAAAGFPAIVKASALGKNGAVAPSNRVVMAIIGVGWMGDNHVGSFLKIPEAQLVAVCDVDDEHLQAAKQKIDEKYGNQDCVTYRAFEEVLSRRDIDAVSIAVPDHWHGITAVCALRAGKDVYGEKPLAHTFQEGLAIAEAAHRYKRVWQTGSWQRSRENFRHACELVRNGRIGKVRRVEVGMRGRSNFDPVADQFRITDPPVTLNYDRWLGPAPEAPYCVGRAHKNWRWNLDYGGGQLMDWVGHYVDIAHWGLGFDNTGPVEVEGKGTYPPRDAVWNTPTTFRITARYEGGVTMIIAAGSEDIWESTKWIGDDGWIWVDRGDQEAEPASVLTSEIKPSEIHLPKSPGHYEEFIQCVKSRGVTLTPAEVALRSTTPAWLGEIAMLTGRKIRWDPKEQRLLNDPEAEKLLSRNMRIPWRL